MAAAASTKHLLRQLKDKDASRRKAAIKALARAKDRNALTQLARMSGDDRDAEVRELALKAGQYILHETGGIEAHKEANKSEEAEGPPPIALDKKGHPVRIPVSKEDAERAQRLVESAMNATQNNDVVRAMRALSKALTLNANLRIDSYFSSLAEQATGLEGNEAIEKLYSKDAQTEAEEAATQARRREHNAAHMDKVNQFGWKDAGLDMAMLAIISAVASVVIGFLAMQSAQGYIESVYANWDKVMEAQRADRVERDPESKRFGYYYEEEMDMEGNPVYFKAIEPDDQFWNTTNIVAESDALTILGGGLGGGLGGAFLFGLMVLIIHVISSLVGGRGTLTYTGHQVLGLLVNRAVILATILGIGTYLIFSNGGGSMITIIGVICGIVLLQMFLKLLGRLTDAYDYGMPQALIALTAGLMAFVPVSIMLMAVL